MAFLDLYPPETPLRRVASVRQLNRIVNILMTMEGVGIRIERDRTRNGRGWKLVLDEEVWRQLIPDGDYDGDLLAWDDTAKAWKQVGVNPSKGDVLYYNDGWKIPPVLDAATVPDYALVRVDDGQGGYTVGWRAVTDDCETSEGEES